MRDSNCVISLVFTTPLGAPTALSGTLRLVRGPASAARCASARMSLCGSSPSKPDLKVLLIVRPFIAEPSSPPAIPATADVSGPPAEPATAPTAEPASAALYFPSRPPSTRLPSSFSIRSMSR